MSDFLCSTVLVLNVLWFSVGFHYFSITLGQRAVLSLVLAIAHGSQCYFNIPIARRRPAGGGTLGRAQGADEVHFCRGCDVDDCECRSLRGLLSGRLMRLH